MEAVNDDPPPVLVFRNRMTNLWRKGREMLRLHMPISHMLSSVILGFPTHCAHDKGIIRWILQEVERMPLSRRQALEASVVGKNAPLLHARVEIVTDGDGDEAWEAARVR